jgi:hypothetical protein
MLTEALNTRWIATNLVLHLLYNNNKQNQLPACKNLQDQPKQDTSLPSKDIKGDQSCVYGYNPELKQQLSPRNRPPSPCPKHHTSGTF